MESFDMFKRKVSLLKDWMNYTDRAKSFCTSDVQKYLYWTAMACSVEAVFFGLFDQEIAEFLVSYLG